ncbi:hypothetical protein [Streptomyces sp. CoH17]|uniref:hypothetical protein n=1 Tax=Streptomyces sp. CoH17 TaxID=2992806 RepID=UPI002271EA87|nr:hypothetical protein [Streptomyces sp. CoH17]
MKKVSGYQSCIWWKGTPFAKFDFATQPYLVEGITFEEFNVAEVTDNPNHVRDLARAVSPPRRGTCHKCGQTLRVSAEGVFLGGTHKSNVYGVKRICYSGVASEIIPAILMLAELE